MFKQISTSPETQNIFFAANHGDLMKQITKGQMDRFGFYAQPSALLHPL